jgi:hypothetical protein
LYSSGDWNGGMIATKQVPKKKAINKKKFTGCLCNKYF